jgi:hypothetical protein
MNFISKIYKKLLIAYKGITDTNSIIIKEKKSGTSKHLDEASAIFKLLNNNQIFVVLDIPSISEHYDPVNMIKDSENYANFLVHITNGLLYDQILNIVKDKLSKTEDVNNKLFLENVLYFFSAIETDLEKSLTRKLLNKEPLIRPLSVFNATKG